MTDLCALSAVEARRLIGRKAVSPVELTDACIARIEAVDGALNAVVTPCFARAREEAKAAEAAVLAGDDLPALHGLPIGIKDLNETAGVRTTFGSLLYEGYVPAADERGVAAIRAAGGIVVGKTNTPEFGAGANTTNRVFGATGNPFDPALTCGGSSGGSAVALATGMVPLASGSDYGGSLRTPAAFCGVVGFRPSPGTVPDPTRVVGQSPFSVEGPMGRCVADAALLLRVQMGFDKHDPYSGRLDPALFEAPVPADLSRLRVAFTEDLGAAPVDDEIRAVFRQRAEQIGPWFKSYDWREPDLGDRVHDVFEILRGVNFIAAHGDRLASSRDRLGPNVIDNTERGYAHSAADIAWAHDQQSRIARRFLDFFSDVDLIVAPAASVSPFPHDQLFVTEINGERMSTYMRWLAISYCVTMATPPVCCLPCGVDHRGLPFGIQVIGSNGWDRSVLDAALALEQAMAERATLRRPVPDIAALAR